MLQFAKKLHRAEHDAAPRLGLRIVQADRDTPEACAAQIMELAREQISQVDVLILDELGEAMRRGFVTREDVEALIAMKPTTTELVLTGRGLLPLADLADLVTEMRPVKHYFDEGLLARQGIEYYMIRRGRRKTDHFALSPGQGSVFLRPLRIIRRWRGRASCRCGGRW